MALLSNRKLMENGYAPFTRNGEQLCLVHINDLPNSTTAELTNDECRQIMTLKPGNVGTDIDREAVARARRKYWKNRLGIQG